ncbi:MAG: aldehyde dehydrogenase family protein [Rhizobiaceae bacterium]|nr:aldehyde dehydrogenase family protein [Rhizobiaceae bacterium]
MLTNPKADQGLAALPPSLLAPRTNITGGRFAAARSGQTLDVACPSDGGVFSSIPRSDADDVDEAVRAAHQAFHEGPWATFSALDRGRLITKLMGIVDREADALAALESRDTGKPVRLGRADVNAALRYLEFYGGAADKLTGETIPFLDGHTALTLRVPHGVVASIIPWNYPLHMVSRLIGAACGMGNTLVLKPAEDASLSALRFAELALEAGFPAGVINVVTGLGPEAGAALAAHPLVDFVTFTGSSATGAVIQALAARHNRGTSMELGGKSAQILFADADVDAALPVIQNAIIQNAGQTCSAGSRLLVDRRIHGAVIEALAERFSRLVAAPHWQDGDLGPMINAKQAERVRGFIARARSEGARLAAQGGIADGAPSGGHYVPPALFDDVPPESELFRDEVFGPVLAVTPFEDEAEAARLANATDFGLVAGVWTRDGGRQHRMAKRIRAGQVFINAYGAGGGVELPFGGFGRSGHGREKGMEFLRHMSATKTVVFNHG